MTPAADRSIVWALGIPIRLAVLRPRQTATPPRPFLSPLCSQHSRSFIHPTDSKRISRTSSIKRTCQRAQFPEHPVQSLRSYGLASASDVDATARRCRWDPLDPLAPNYMEGRFLGSSVMWTLDPGDACWTTHRQESTRRLVCDVGWQAISCYVAPSRYENSTDHKGPLPIVPGTLRAHVEVGIAGGRECRRRSRGGRVRERDHPGC